MTRTQDELKSDSEKAQELLKGELRYAVRVTGGLEALHKAFQDADIEAYEISCKHPVSFLWEEPDAQPDA